MQADDHDKVKEALDSVEAPVSASECHGMLAAQLSMQSANGAVECIRHIFDDIDSTSPSFMTALKAIEELVTTTQTDLNDPDISFQLLLPEQSNMADRLLALSEWCQGYLFGLGLAGVTDDDNHSADIKEMLQDFIQISHIDVEDTSESDESERDYIELVEFVRIGVLYLQEECNPLTQEQSTE